MFVIPKGFSLMALTIVPEPWITSSVLFLAPKEFRFLPRLLQFIPVITVKEFLNLHQSLSVSTVSYSMLIYRN